MTDRERFGRAPQGGIVGRPVLLVGLFIGSMAALLPLGIVAPLEFGFDTADFSDRHSHAIIAAFLAAFTAGFVNPSGTKATVLAVLGGAAVAALAFAGSLGPELFLARSETPGLVAAFALRLGGMVPAMAVVGITIRGLTPRHEGDSVPDTPTAGERKDSMRRGLDEAAAGIAVMVGGFLAMFGGWEVLGRFVSGFPHAAMLAMPALFGPVLAGALAFGMRVEGGMGHARSFLGGFGLVLLVWIVTTAAVLAAMPDSGQPAGEEERWDAAVAGTIVGCGSLFLLFGLISYLERRRRPPRAETVASAQPAPTGMAVPGPVHSIPALVLMVVLLKAVQTGWPDTGSLDLLASIFPAMALLNARPYGLVAWVWALVAAMTVFALLLGGFLLGDMAADRWAGESALLMVALMLAFVLPSFFLAMAIQTWLPAKLPRTLPSHRDGGSP